MIRLCKTVSPAWVNPGPMYRNVFSEYCFIEFLMYTIK